MLKKKALRKIIITTFLFFLVLSIYILPNKKESNNIVYNYIDPTSVSVYLINNYDQLTKVDFKINNGTKKEIIETIIKKLTKSKDATIPSSFYQVIPEDIKLKKCYIEEGIVYLDFSKEFLNIDNNDIEKVIEAISYSLLELDDIKGVSIYSDEVSITDHFPIDIPSIITKEYGINKRYEINNLNDISKVVIYYLTDVENTNYYVPITKYVNDDREKIKIIIDELSSNYIYESNLISLLNRNLKLLDYEIKNDSVILDFNNSIFVNDSDILEEVVYTISYSVFANYDVSNVYFKVNGEDLIKKVQKIN